MAKNPTILPHCTVILEGQEHTYEGDSGEEGIISFGDIAEDVYTLTVKKEGYEDYIEEGIVIDEKNKTINARVELKELAHEITLIVLTSPDEVENMTVSLTDTQGQIVYHGRTDKDGQVTFTKVEYGQYLLKVTGDGYQRYTSNIKVNSTNKNPRTIEVPLVKEETKKE